MILVARFDPVPAVCSLLAFPEPASGFQVVHRVIDRVYSTATVAGGGGHEHDWLAGPHYSGPVDDQQAHQAESLDGARAEFLHRGERQRCVMGEFERLDIRLTANLTDEGAYPAEPRMRAGEWADKSAGIERTVEQADVEHWITPR